MEYSDFGIYQTYFSKDTLTLFEEGLNDWLSYLRPHVGDSESLFEKYSAGGWLLDFTRQKLVEPGPVSLVSLSVNGISLKYYRSLLPWLKKKYQYLKDKKIAESAPVGSTERLDRLLENLNRLESAPIFEGIPVEDLFASLTSSQPNVELQEGRRIEFRSPEEDK